MKPRGLVPLLVVVMVVMALSSWMGGAEAWRQGRMHRRGRGRGIYLNPFGIRRGHVHGHGHGHGQGHGHRRAQADSRGGERAPYSQGRPSGRSLWNSLFRLHDYGGSFRLGPLGGFGRGIRFTNLRRPWKSDFDFDFARQRDWWEGPNVCRSDEKKNASDGESNAVAHHFKTSTQVCERSDTSYKCTTTIQSAEGAITKVELYECCHGYSRKAEEFGCPQKLQLADLPKTARHLGLNDLLAAVRRVGLEEELARGNFTLFAPVDGALQLSLHSGGSGVSLKLRDQPRPRKFWSDEAGEGEEDEEEDEEDEDEEDLEKVVLRHLVPDARRASSFSDEDVLETGSPVDSTIRVNFYSRPERLTTANCVRVTSSDHLATNGVIHVVEEALPSVTASLLEMVQRDPQFSYLKTALSRASLVSTLQEDGQFTLFAPTNSAFQRLDKALLDKLLSGDRQCLTKVVQHHILPNVICSTIIQGLAKSRNLLNSYVNLTRTEDGKLFVDDAQVVRTDVMATNGVMHVIDAVILPDDALDVVSVAKKNGLTELIQLVDEAGMTSSLQNASDITVFAPSNEAIQALSPEVKKRLEADPELLQDVLKYHLVPHRFPCRPLYHDRHLRTLNPKGGVFISEYSSFPFGRQRVTTVQCAPVVRQKMLSCNGAIHVIQRVLLPPPGNIIDVLAADSSFGTLVRLLKKAGIADSLQDEGPFTLFAPTNEAFQQLGEEKMKELEGDAEQLASLLKFHISDSHLCCAGIFDSPWWYPQKVSTQSGLPLSLSRDRRGRPLVSSAVIGSCDNTATNGVVHGIDSVILPRRRNPWYMFP